MLPELDPVGQFSELAIHQSYEDAVARRSFEDTVARRKSESAVYDLSKKNPCSTSTESTHGRPCQSTLDTVMSETETSLRRTRLRKSGTGTFSGGSGQTMSDSLPTFISDRNEPRSSTFHEIVQQRAIKTDKFKLVIIIVILLNMWALATEVDFPEWPYWVVVNIIFLFIYIIEFVVRSAKAGLMNLLWHGRSRKTRLWVWYDLVVIILGVMDLLFAKLCNGPHIVDVEDLIAAGSKAASEYGHQEQAQSLLQPLVRCLQISRLLRVPRIVHLIPDLYAFVCMLLTMFANVMGWIFTVIFIFCFIFAIILTRMLGHGLIVNTDSSDSWKVQEMFADIPTSMFTLFQLTTADDWMYIAQPVISMSDGSVGRSIWRLFFIFFITFMCWTMLSLLTAVASETMISNTSYKKKDEIQKQEMQRQQFIEFLCEQFVQADEDRNGVLDKSEFKELMATPSVKQNMKEHGINLDESDIERTWKTFDVDDSGVLDINELVDGFALLQEGLATKHVATIGYSLKRFSLQLDQDIGCLEDGAEKLQDQFQELSLQLQAQQKLYKKEWFQFLQQQNQGRRDQS